MDKQSETGKGNGDIQKIFKDNMDYLFDVNVNYIEIRSK